MKYIQTLLSFAKSYRVYLFIAAGVAVALFGSYEAGRWKGKQEQKVIQAEAQTKAITKGVQSHGTKQKEVNRLSDPDLDSRLDQWMRD